MKVLWQIVNSLVKSRVGVRSRTRLWVSAANADGNDGVLIRTLEVSTAARDLDLLRAVSDYVAVLAVLWRMEMIAVIKKTIESKTTLSRMALFTGRPVLNSLPRSPRARKPTFPRANPRVVPEAWMIEHIFLLKLSKNVTHVPIGDRLTNNFVRKLGHVHDAAPPEYDDCDDGDEEEGEDENW